MPLGAQIADDPSPLDDFGVVTAIDADVAVRSQASAPERDTRAASTYLGVRVGDVHQLLHVSCTDDRGGKAIRPWGPCVENLHVGWDPGLTEHTLGRDVWHIACELHSGITAVERAAPHHLRRRLDRWGPDSHARRGVAGASWVCFSWMHDPNAAAMCWRSGTSLSRRVSYTYNLAGVLDLTALAALATWGSDAQRLTHTEPHRARAISQLCRPEGAG